MLELSRVEREATPRGLRRRWAILRDGRTVPRILMAAPAVIWLVLFSYVPMFGLIIAFKDYRFDLGIWRSPWIGLTNFRFLVGTSDAWRALTNTLILNSVFIASTLIVSLGVAILLYQIQHSFMARLYQAALFFPYFISWVIAGVFMLALLSSDSGLVNRLLASWGLSKVSWYSTPRVWPYILTASHLWKSVGFWSIVYFAGMLGISPEYYEAAEVDGATGWKKTLHITLPLLTPLIIINVLLSIGRIFYADFGLFFHVTRDQGTLYPTTDVIDTYVFRGLTKSAQIGMVSAAGFYQSVIGFALVFLSNWVVRRIDPDRSLF
jgi:putative aldouronate transport system permease protein